MYRKALNYLRGQAVVRITCETPERVVNLCAAHGVPFWDLTWETAAAFRVTTTLSGVEMSQWMCARSPGCERSTSRTRRRTSHSR